MSAKQRIFGRIMRLPSFDGRLPDAGPVHIVSDAGEEYLLVASDSSAPGAVEDLAAQAAPLYEPYLDQDKCVGGDVYGTVIWQAEVLNDA